jgi:hypothetical protein
MGTCRSKHLGFLVAGIAFLSLPAQAQIVPAACTDSLFNKRSFIAGFAVGEDAAIQVWAGIDEDCDRREEFGTVVTHAVMDFALPDGASQFITCRYHGYIAGVLRGIHDAFSSCSIPCEPYEGELFGEISAIAYCQLSLANDWPPSADDFAPLWEMILCGDWHLYVPACGLSYNTVTRAYVDDTRDDPETTDVNEGECKPYTDMGDIVDPETGDPLWEPDWNEVREVQCAAGW